jgi:hypothetical protein
VLQIFCLVTWFDGILFHRVRIKGQEEQGRVIFFLWK